MRKFLRTLVFLLRYTALFALGVIALFLLGMVVGTATRYNNSERAADGFGYLTRDWIKKAAVYGYGYDPEIDDGVIVIPESYGKYPVKELGGYVGVGAPSPFYIDLKGRQYSSMVGPSNGSFDWYLKTKDLELVYYDVTLNIGPNIRQIYAAMGGFKTERELVVVRVYVNCDPANPSFYSENGILYHKDGQVVKGLLYWNQS